MHALKIYIYQMQLHGCSRGLGIDCISLQCPLIFDDCWWLVSIQVVCGDCLTNYVLLLLYDLALINGGLE